MKNILVFLFLCCSCCYAQKKSVIYSGVPWFDDRSQIVNAHGACIVEDGGKYYLFGEFKTDSANTFIGFSCYSSEDLVNWEFERLVLPVQKKGPLGPNRIGERVKVMKSPSTGEYVMYMHTDDRFYKDPQVGYATSKTINGEYTFQGPILYQGKPIRKWDMGTFQDNDGVGYLLIHHGDVFRLSKDYKTAEEKVAVISGVGESPAMFKKKGIYYLLSSGLTSWERNDNIYHTANNIVGPWTKQGVFCPEGSLTHNSQCSFVFPIVRGIDTIPMYMGDRWSFPKQGQAATQVWQKLIPNGEKLSMPTYWQAWDYHKLCEIVPVNSIHSLSLSSNQKGASIDINYDGKPIEIIGTSGPDGGYARISISDKKGKVVISSQVDFYSKVLHEGIRYVSPELKKGKYQLKIEVSEEQGVWYNKRGNRFGSSGFWVRVSGWRRVA